MVCCTKQMKTDCIFNFQFSYSKMLVTCKKCNKTIIKIIMKITTGKLNNSECFYVALNRYSHKLWQIIALFHILSLVFMFWIQNSICCHVQPWPFTHILIMRTFPLYLIFFFAPMQSMCNIPVSEFVKVVETSDIMW